MSDYIRHKSIHFTVQSCVWLKNNTSCIGLFHTSWIFSVHLELADWVVRSVCVVHSVYQGKRLSHNFTFSKQRLKFMFFNLCVLSLLKVDNKCKTSLLWYQDQADGVTVTDGVTECGAPNTSQPLCFTLLNCPLKAFSQITSPHLVSLGVDAHSGVIYWSRPSL